MTNSRSPSTLADYIRVKHGFAFKGEYFTENVTPDVLITPGNFAIGGGFQDGKLKYYSGPVPDEYILHEDDLVVTMTDLSKAGDTLGYPALIPDSPGRRYLHNQRIGLIEIRDNVEADRRFLFYCLCSKDYRHHILATASGSTVRHTSPGRICEFETTLPSLDDQRAIAGVLGSVDDTIKQNRRTAQTLERLARAIFRAWFVDFEPVKAKAAGAISFPSMPQEIFDTLPTTFTGSEIGHVPDGWEIDSLSRICTILSGGTPKRSEPSYWDGDVSWYSVKDAPADGEVWVISTDESITEAGLQNSAAQVIPKGCTIISARGTVGKLALAGRPMAFNQSCYGLMPTDGISCCFLYLLMQSVIVDLQQRTHGSVFDTITRSTFDSIPAIAPPPHVLAGFEIVVQVLFDLLLEMMMESAKLGEMRDYLLPRLLSDQVQVKFSDA